MEIFFTKKKKCTRVSFFLKAGLFLYTGSIDPRRIAFYFAAHTIALFIFDIRPIASAAVSLRDISNTNKRVNIKCLGINRILIERIARFTQHYKL